MLIGLDNATAAGRKRLTRSPVSGLRPPEPSDAPVIAPVGPPINSPTAAPDPIAANRSAVERNGIRPNSGIVTTHCRSSFSALRLPSA
jgi:hypothetical protein